MGSSRREITTCEEHFRHRFCDRDCMTNWLNDSDNSLDELFAQGPNVYTDCTHCEDALEGNSSGGFGVAVDTNYENRLYFRTLMHRGMLPDDGILLLGYGGGVRNSDDIGNVKDITASYSPTYQLTKNQQPATKNKSASGASPTMGIKPTLDSVTNTLKSDAIELRTRLGAKQLLRAGTAVVEGLATRYTNAEAAAAAKIFLNSPLGQALLGASFSAAGVTLLPATMQTPEVLALLREARLQPAGDAGDMALELVAAPLREVITAFIGDVSSLKNQMGPGEQPVAAITAGGEVETAETETGEQPRERRRAAPRTAAKKKVATKPLKGSGTGGGGRIVVKDVNGAKRADVEA